LDVGDTCELGSDCVTGFCVGTCERPCTTTAECGASECAVREVNGAAIGLCSTPECGCSGQAVCSSGGLCVDAHTCTTSANCPENERCSGGLCLRPCSAKRDC